MTLHLKPELAAGLKALAHAQGLSVEDYLKQLVERELSASAPDGTTSGEDGMVWEKGLFVYRTGKPLPSHVVDDAVRRSRDERSKHLLDDLS